MLGGDRPQPSCGRGLRRPRRRRFVCTLGGDTEMTGALVAQTRLSAQRRSDAAPVATLAERVRCAVGGGHRMTPRGPEAEFGVRALTSIVSRVLRDVRQFSCRSRRGACTSTSEVAERAMDPCHTSAIVDDVATRESLRRWQHQRGSCSRRPFVPTNGGASLTRAVGCLRTRGTRS